MPSGYVAIGQMHCLLHSARLLDRAAGGDRGRLPHRLRIIAELNPGGLLPLERMQRTLRTLAQEVVPALK